MKSRLLLCLSVLLVACSTPKQESAPSASLLPAGWDAKAAGDKVMAGLIKATGPDVKGAHDSHLAIVGDRAYVIAEVNDRQAGEAANWPFIYVTLSIVDLRNERLLDVMTVARSEQAFANETLPVGACFVPRVKQVGPRTLRCWFASEQPGKRQSQTYYRDFDLTTLTFERDIHRMKLTTSAGTFDLQPKPFHDDAADTLTIVGHFNGPGEPALTEPAVNRLPDGTWLAISRKENGDHNYWFSESQDGQTWTTGGEKDFVKKGAGSKPTFDKFDGVYYLGWQERTQIEKVSRSVFNIDVSRDGKTWERKYRFETTKSFQYPTFVQDKGVVWFCVTQGDSDPTRKERIMFGRLE